MITAIKNILSGVLQDAGIPAERIARNAREEQALVSRREVFPFASLVTDPGRFESPDHKEVRLKMEGKTLYRQIRTKRIIPMVVKITGKDEAQSGEILSQIIARLPFAWEYKGIQGTIEPTHEEYSDYDSRMNARHEAVVVVEFAVDVGPEGLEAVPVGGIKEGEGVYEQRK